jgi:uncharacterized protein YdiU (UPF0061 family)
MLMRVAESHVRFGHFEHFYYRREPQKVQQLADYVIRHHWPQLQDEADKYCYGSVTLSRVPRRLIASWQTVGFAHGVMNTDNMSILGLTMDYGPYGFLDDFNRTLSATTPIIRGATALKTSRRLGCGICNVSRSRCRRLSALMRLTRRWMSISTPC